MNLKVSVVIPTLLRQDVLINTLRNLSTQKYPYFEIIVVDQTETVSPELKKFLIQNPSIIYIYQEEKSSPLARNTGAKKANGDILLFLDDDIEIQNTDFISQHFVHFTDPKIGMVGGRVVYGSEQPTYPEVGKLKYWGLKEITHFDSVCPAVIDHAPGGNMSVRKKIFFEVGGFSEIYKGNAHMEETDFCLRIKRAGHRAIFEPKAVLKHLQASRGGNRAQDIYQFRYWLVRNFVVFYLKNYPKILFPLCFVREFIWALGSGLKRKDLKMFKIMYKAIIDGVNYSRSLK